MPPRPLFVLVISSLVLAPAPLRAHRPLEAQAPPDDPERAVLVPDPTASQVLYAELDPARPEVWLRFEAEAGDPLYFSVGVPVLARLRDLRPRVALVGPSREPLEVPFEVPDGLGGRVFAPEGPPRFFHEPFTGTDSWIVQEATVRLPEGGTWYLVAYPDRPCRPGDKLWVSVGTKERFELGDLFLFPRWRREIRAFHEVDGPAEPSVAAAPAVVAAADIGGGRGLRRIVTPRRAVAPRAPRAAAPSRPR